MKKRNTTKTKLIATIISMVCAISLLAVGVMASLTNFQVAIANQLNLKFDAVEGTLYATRLGDVAGTDRTTSKVLSESTTATDWLKVYDGTTTEGVQNDALTSIQEKVDFISNDAIKAKVNAGTTSIAITYYFYYTLPTNAVSNDVVLTAPAVADSNVAITYSYVKGTGATLPDFTSGTALTNGETVQVAGGEHLFIKAEAKVDLSKSVKIENANWNFTLNFGISKYTLTGDTLNINAVSGAETYEIWAKEVASVTTSATEAGGALMLAAVGDTDATLGTLVKVLAKSEISNIDLTTALSTLIAGTYKLTVVPKNTSGVEIAGSRVAVKYTLVPKPITLTFRIVDAGSSTTSGSGITNVTQNGTEITSLEVESGLTLKQILANYNLTLVTYSGSNITASNFDSLFDSSYWDKGTNLNITFTENTTITLSYIWYNNSCFTADTDVLCYDEKKKKFYKKKIKDITYSDLVACWDFDNGKLTYSKVIWIRKPESKQCLIRELTFTGGTKLTIVDEHMMFAANKGKFVTDFEVGDQFMNEKGEYITLTKIEESYRTEVPYAIATNYHINCFTGGVVGSLGYNNLYPIKDRKFVKDDRKIVPFEELKVPREYYDGFRLGEVANRTPERINSSINNYFVKNMLPKEQKL